MATVYIFDLNGTFDRLPHPHEVLALLREQDPGCWVVLYTGVHPHTVQEMFPELSVDALWEKPCRLDVALTESGWNFNRIVVVDDMESMRRLAQRSLRRMGIPFEIHDQNQLENLVGHLDE